MPKQPKKRKAARGVYPLDITGLGSLVAAAKRRTKITSKAQLLRLATDYMREITAEVREEETDARGRVRYRWNKKRKDDHFRDCELEIMASAIMAKKIGRIEEETADDGQSDDGPKE